MFNLICYFLEYPNISFERSSFLPSLWLCQPSSLPESFENIRTKKKHMHKQHKNSKKSHKSTIGELTNTAGIMSYYLFQYYALSLHILCRFSWLPAWQFLFCFGVSNRQSLTNLISRSLSLRFASECFMIMMFFFVLYKLTWTLAASIWPK